MIEYLIILGGILWKEISIYDGINYQRKFEQNFRNLRRQILAYKRSELYMCYKMYNQNIAELMKSISIADNLDYYFAIYYYLLYKGILSDQNGFVFGTDRDEILFNKGLSVVSGKGVCRNIASNFLDVLSIIYPKMLILNSAIFLEDTALKLPDHENIPRTVDRTGIVSSISGKVQQSNHMALLIVNGGDKFLYCPTNFIKARIDINSSDGIRKFFDLRFNLFDVSSPTDDLEGGLNCLKIFHDKMKRYEYAKWDRISMDSHILLRQVGYDMCESNIRLIEAFKKLMKS